MENLNHDDSVNDNLNTETITKGETIRKKIEKSKKDEIRKSGFVSDELVAIGKSVCGRWVKFQKRLGEGGYKTVFMAYDSEKGNNVAWCEFKPHHVDTKEKQANMMHEIEIMVRMDHPNIVTCYDVFDEYIDILGPNGPVPFKSIILIQELMGEGTLKSVIKKNFINGKLILKFTLITYWLHQIVSALSYMHEKLNPPIIHRDLKADNCFLESKSSEKYLNVKVGDFGLAKQLGNKEKHTMLGTVGFMAPEVYDEKYDAKVDIYAFGMLMLEVVTNRTPYDDCETVMQVAKQTMSGKLPEIFTLVQDQGTREVISCCIHPLALYRPSAMELFYHPMFLNRNDDELKDMLPVEITPNFDKFLDREVTLNSFVSNIFTETGGYNTKFNLRMDFRDKRIQRSLNLDDGESLEFDLDVYKQTDIPELISNLKSEFQDSIKEGLNPNKMIEAKQINAHLERIFKSMELQMNFMLKMILGKRWFYILKSILSKQTDLDLKDDMTGFSLLATYKTNWMSASKQLEAEITEYGKVDKNNEMKKISKIFKIPDFVKGESNLVYSNEYAQIDKKTVDSGPKAMDSLYKIDTSENTTFLPSASNYMFPPQPPFYPFNFPQYPTVPGSIPNNQFFWNPYGSMMPPVQNMMEPMSSYLRNQETPSSQQRRSQVNSKVMKPTSGASNVGGSTPKSPSAEKQEQKDDPAVNTERVFTFEEVMIYISSKSHRHSKHPFMVIPVYGQSNSFKLVKVNDPNYIEVKKTDLSNESPNKRGARSPQKSIKSNKTNTDVSYSYMIGSNPNVGIPQPMFNNPAGNYQTYQGGPQMALTPQYMQYWMQQQNYIQFMMQQQQMQQQFLYSQQTVPPGNPLDDHTEQELWIKRNTATGSNYAQEYVPVKPPKEGETSPSKFRVETIEETISHELSSDDASGGINVFGVNNAPNPVKDTTKTSKGSSKTGKRQENDNKSDEVLKKNNFHIGITNETLEKERKVLIDSHGENSDLKLVLNANSMTEGLNEKGASKSLGCQTLWSANLFSKSGKFHTLETCKDTLTDVLSKEHGGIYKSPTYDFSDSNSDGTININMSLSAQVPNNENLVIDKINGEKK